MLGNNHDKGREALVNTTTRPVRLPYFDYLLSALNDGNEIVNKTLGRHVHWGYWEQPKLASLTADDFAQAAEKLSAEVCKAGQVANNLSVLDVGCGFGGTIAHINENYHDMKLVGLNLDERQLQRARANVLPVSTNSIDFKQGNACALPFANESFDVVMAVECAFHFPSREGFFKEAYRVLKPGGYLALSDFVTHPLIHPFAKMKLPERVSIGFYGQCNLQYSVTDYRKLVEAAKFKILTERDITANTLPTYRYFRRMEKQYHVKDKFAYAETATAECLSRTRLLRYFIYGLQKAG